MSEPAIYPLFLLPRKKRKYNGARSSLSSRSSFFLRLFLLPSLSLHRSRHLSLGLRLSFYSVISLSLSLSLTVSYVLSASVVFVHVGGAYNVAFAIFPDDRTHRCRCVALTRMPVIYERINDFANSEAKCDLAKREIRMIRGTLKGKIK